MARLHLSDLYAATAEQLTDELAAAAADSTPRPLAELRADVARLIHETWGANLCDEQNDVLREATVEETVDSVLAGPEGWILVDGRRCYVAE